MPRCIPGGPWPSSRRMTRCRRSSSGCFPSRSSRCFDRVGCWPSSSAGFRSFCSRWAGTHLPYFHYGAPLAPLAIAGALHVLATRRELATRGSVLLVGGAVAALAVMSPLSWRAPTRCGCGACCVPTPARERPQPSPRSRPRRPVSATPRVLAHLAHRPEAWIFPTPFQPLKPAALGPEPSEQKADRVRVVVVDRSSCERAEQLGFRVTPIAPGRHCLGQR